MSLPVRTRVLLVDDHPLVRVGLAHLIAEQPGLEVCAQAGSTAEVPRLVRDLDPDVVVLDLMLADGSGLDLLRSLLAEFPHLEVLVLSMHDQRIYAERCLQAGAKGYLMKEEAADLVVAALRTVADGGRFLSPSMPTRGAARLPLETLSDREMQVFELIGGDLPTRLIADRLGLSDKTVEAHKANIKKKLGVAHFPELARLAAAWRETGRCVAPDPTGA
jgi:DNA-binding NarL/FixJ family response regulator